RWESRRFRPRYYPSRSRWRLFHMVIWPSPVTRNPSTIDASAEPRSTPLEKFEVDPFRTPTPSRCPEDGCAAIPAPAPRKHGAAAARDGKPGEMDGDEAGGNPQTVGVGARREIVNEPIRARFVDGSAFLDLSRAFFSPTLCLGSHRPDDYCPKR